MKSSQFWEASWELGMAEVIVRVNVAPAREHEAEPAMTASSLGNDGIERALVPAARRALQVRGRGVKVFAGGQENAMLNVNHAQRQ